MSPNLADEYILIAGNQKIMSTKITTSLSLMSYEYPMPKLLHPLVEYWVEVLTLKQNQPAIMSFNAEFK